MSRILVIEDDVGIRRTLDRGLRLAGHAPTFATDADGGRSAWREGAFDVVVLDVMLPDGDGIELLVERRRAGDPTPVMLLTAREEAALRERAIAAGADDYVTKPFAYADLLARLERLVATAGAG